VVPALEELQEDENNNLSQLASNIMNHFDYLSDYRPTLKKLQDKKRIILKNYLLPFSSVISETTKHDKLSITINWDHYQDSENTKRRNIIHLFKSYMWGPLKQSLEAFCSKFSKTFASLSRIVITSCDTINSLKFEDEILFYVIGVEENRPMSTQEFLTSIETIFQDRIKKNRENTEDIKKMIQKTPLKVLKKIALEGHEENSISQILSHKGLPQLTDKEKQMIDKSFSGYLKCWKVTILENQIESIYSNS
jgi:hypothetical protein